MKHLAALLLGALLAWGCAGNQAGKSEKAEPSYVVRAWSFQRLREVEGHLAGGDHAAAAEVLQRMEERKGLNEHERALMWRQRAHLHASQQQYGPALKSLLTCLELNALPPVDTLAAQYNLAQLYLANERYGDAADTLVAWLGQTEEPPTDAVFMAATSLIRAKRRAEALPWLERAIAERGEQAPEDWVRLMANVLIEEGDYARAEGWLKRLIQSHPSKVYWLRLHAVYMQLERPERALAVLQVMDREKMLTEESELLSLAQRYMGAQMPERAVKVMQRGLGSGVITENAEHLRLLANALVLSRMPDPAIAVLMRAGDLSADGELYVSAARLMMEKERYADAVKALNKAFATDGLKAPGEAYLLLGIARFHAGAMEAARQAFHRAKQVDSTRQPAAQWLQHLEARQ